MAASYRSGIPWLPGALAAIDLAASHYPTALASGSHPALIDVVTADDAVRGKFEVIVAADEVGAGKPAPDVYLAAAERLYRYDNRRLENPGGYIVETLRAVFQSHLPMALSTSRGIGVSSISARASW